MPCKILVRAVDNPAIPESEKDYRSRWRKGDVIGVFNNRHVFGKSEVLPNFVAFTVGNSVRKNHRNLERKWMNEFTTTTEASPKTGKVRLRIADQNKPKHAKQKRGKIRRRDGNAIVKSLNAETEIIKDNDDILLDIDPAKALDAHNEVMDLMKKPIRIKMFRINPTLIDQAIAGGGTLKISKKVLDDNTEDYRDLKIDA